MNNVKTVSKKMIDINSPYLPSLRKYISYIEGIYARGYLTNNGPLVRELTARLEDYFCVRNMILVCSGSAALGLAYHALNVHGTVITTPFSFVASSSVPLWNNIQPIFIDIDPDNWNMDPANIEFAIRSDTVAIAPVHVYGNPVDEVGVSGIAHRRGLKVIYDAAHCFGTRKNGQPILHWGDASAISFHATKIFHTIEGGAVIFSDADICEHARHMVNFGIDVQTGSIVEIGTNLKMSEMHAAMGLAMLDDMQGIIERRSTLACIYRKRLNGYVKFQKIENDVNTGSSYMPIALSDERTCEYVIKHLTNENIRTRRYFYPSLDAILPHAISQFCQNSQNIAERVICLPLHARLSSCDVNRVCTQILRSLE